MQWLLREVGNNHAAGFLLVLGRIGPMFLLAPLFSSRTIPMRARAIVAVALAVGFTPFALADQRIPMELSVFAGLMLKEIGTGLGYAFVVAAVFAALNAAGSMLDTLIGFSFGALVDPLTGTQSAVLAQAYALFGTMVFIAIGGDRLVVYGLARTYDTVGLLEYPSLSTMTASADAAFGGIFGAALAVAAPVVLALILTDVAFGVVSRVVPTLNVFAAGFAAKIAVGLLVIGATLPFVAGWVADHVEGGAGQAFRAIGVSS